MAMATTATASASASATARHLPTLLPIEEMPESSRSSSAYKPDSPVTNSPADPKDPEGFLRRCSGYNKKTKVRCSVAIGQKAHHARNSRPAFLPTCFIHQNQRTRAGWCQFTLSNGERCSRLFRWTPPYLQLCSEHEDQPDTPCYFFKLPPETRMQIFSYLLPEGSIGSSTSILHQLERPVSDHESHVVEADAADSSTNSRRHQYQRCGIPSTHACNFQSVFPMPLLDLLLVNQQFYHEAKDVFYSHASFKIDIRKDGTFMCGRRLLEPRRADGSSHYAADEADEAKEAFLATFDWTAVKNYDVDILVENWLNGDPHSDTTPWDEEVEIYDIRDYVGVVISGILSKSRSLCRLKVRLGLSEFRWTEAEVVANTKLLVGPFQRLRNVRSADFGGVFGGKPEHNYMMRIPRPGEIASFSPNGSSRIPTPLCSVPALAVQNPILHPDAAVLFEYKKAWETQICEEARSSLVKKPPIRSMFSEFKDFYAKLSILVPDVTLRLGRHSFLHRARVAREDEDVESFRVLRNELIEHWYGYLEQEEQKKNDLNAKLSRMLDADVYDHHQWVKNSGPSQTAAGPSAIPSALPDVDVVAGDAIATPANKTPMEDNLALPEWRERQQLQLCTDANRNYIAKIRLREQQIQGEQMALSHHIAQTADVPLQVSSPPSSTTTSQGSALILSPTQEDRDSWSVQSMGPENPNQTPNNYHTSTFVPSNLITETQCDWEASHSASPQASRPPAACSQHVTANDLSGSYPPPPLINDSPGSSRDGSWSSGNASFLHELSSPEEPHLVDWDDGAGSSTQWNGFHAGTTEWNYEMVGDQDDVMILDSGFQLQQEITMGSGEDYSGKGKGKMRVDVMERGAAMFTTQY